MPRKPETTSTQNDAKQNTAEATDAGRHHVGRTLESDPEYNDQPARELAPQAGLIDPHGNDLTASPDLRDTSQRIREDTGGRPEPLKTRLPGDTSSDPHTDLGPDNATTVQHRGEDDQTQSQRS
ncbi:hypothetical protein DYQ86_00750 [Acidobacteria bacterium AB60]|nr:hypothetical protein DYQ86_00750 [Acidobacteria bacterium AB60]